MRRHSRRWMAVCLGLLLPLLCTACGANLSDGKAGAARATLAAEIQHAQAIGVEPATVARLTAEETHIDGERGWFGITDAEASTRYTQVYTAVLQSESDAIATTGSAASADLNALYVAVQRGISSNVISAAFLDRWQTWQSDFAAASTPNDYRQLDHEIRADLATVDATETAYTDLADFTQSVTAMRRAGLPVTLELAEAQQAQHLYDQGATAADFTHLSMLLDAEAVGLLTDQVQAIPYLGSSLLDDLQSRITLAQSYGEVTTPFVTDLQTDRQKLANARTLVDFLNLKRQVAKQSSALSVLLVRGQASQDISQLRALLTYCQQHKLMDYEYSAGTGIQGVLQDFASSATVSDYQYVDGEATMLLTNLRAMITNLSDPTPANLAHTTDLELAQAYGVAQGKVIIVSVREQTLRAYDNGQLVFWTYITSGRPELPSPPGFWHVLSRQQNILFTSSEPVGSQYWYAPTLVHFALLFHDGGFFVHDAWWRLHFGPGSNLPHNDPQAFNGGSHGCVNVPLQQMSWLYQWAAVGTPVIVY
jgi:hypothetical protein